MYYSIFVNKLNCISTYLTKTSIDEEAFLEDLGNDITAHGSVPTAIYAFLKALQPLSEFEVGSILAVFIDQKNCATLLWLQSKKPKRANLIKIGHKRLFHP